MTFVCVMRSGGEYSMADVAVLYNAIARHTPRPWQFLCLTDRPAEIGPRCSIVPLASDWPGWWAKMEMFQVGLQACYPMLYLDLDTAVLGDLTSLFRTPPPVFSMLRDFHFPERPASGVMFFPEGFDPSEVWAEFNHRPDILMRRHLKGGDQEYLAQAFRRFGYKPGLLQNQFPGQMFSFKPTRQRWLHEPEQSATLVCFHGQPRPLAVVDQVTWVKDYYERNGVTLDQYQGGIPSEPERVSSDAMAQLKRTKGAQPKSFRVEAPMYEKRHTGTLIVVGSAERSVEDYERVRAARPDAMTAAIGHAAGMLKVDFVVTDHYEVHSKLRALQRVFHHDFTSHCAWKTTWYRWPAVDYWWKWRRSEATSAQSAIRMGLVMGFSEIILCGCPLEAGRIQHPDQVQKDGAVWPPPAKGKGNAAPVKASSRKILTQVRREFRKRAPAWKALNVRSMSGYTRELLGEPEL